MRQFVIAAMLAWTGSAQMVVQPAGIPAAQKLLQPLADEKALRCDVDSSKAELNFGLRFQPGYVLHVPLVQYSGVGHAWQIALRVTPDGGEPAYLTDHFDLPQIVDPSFTGEIAGAFLVGEGRYRVEFAAVDEKLRACRSEWRVEAALGRGDHAVKVAMPPNTVADLSWTGPAAPSKGNPRPRRLTVLMNGSEPYWEGIWTPFRRVIVPHTAGPKIESMMDYRSALVGILASLLEKLPGTTVRLVVFDLDQQKETLRQDNFTAKDIDKAAHAANNTDHWVVTVRELEERPSKWGLLASLVESEVRAEQPSDAVLFLGPRIGPLDKMPAHFLEDDKGSAPRFFYLQYRLSAEPIDVGVPDNMGPRARDLSLPPGYGPDYMPGSPEVSDPIDLLVTRLKGKTLRVHSPTEFAKAVETIRRP